MENENTGRKISRTFGHGRKVAKSCSKSTTPLLQKSRVHDENDHILKVSPFPLAEKKAMHIGSKTLKTVKPRKRLTDITNTPLLPKCRGQEEDDQIFQEPLVQLQDELNDMKKMLAEKEIHIEENKRYMQKLWLNYCRKTKQNDEIILHNSQLGKDLTQALEKVKILEHESVQMLALHKFCKLELQQKQQKLTEVLEEVDRLNKVLVASRSEKVVADQHQPAKSGEVADGDDTCASVHGRSVLRKRQRMHYKEPSLKQKIRQADGEVLCVEQPKKCDDSAVFAQKLGRAEGCEANSTSSKKEHIQCDHTVAAQELGKAEGCRAVRTFRKKELDPYDHTATARSIGKGEACEAVATSSEKDTGMSEKQPCSDSHTGPMQQCTGQEKLGKTEGEQVCNTYYVSTQKLSERPLRRAASSIGSYKEPLLNTKMRRAA